MAIQTFHDDCSSIANWSVSSGVICDGDSVVLDEYGATAVVKMFGSGESYSRDYINCTITIKNIPEDGYLDKHADIYFGTGTTGSLSLNATVFEITNTWILAVSELQLISRIENESCYIDIYADGVFYQTFEPDFGEISDIRIHSRTIGKLRIDNIVYSYEVPSYEVWTATDLDNVRNNPVGKFTQMADIDLSGYANWVPIGDDYTGIFFTGMYDGNGFNVNNLTIVSDGYNCGLFGITTGVIKNLTINNADVRCEARAGALAGLNKGTIQSCHSSGHVLGAYKGAGGLIGFQYETGTCENCSSSCTVEGEHIDYYGFAVGGLIGGAMGIVRKCFATGNCVGGWDVGGLIGVPDEPDDPSGYLLVLENCYATGDVSGHGYVGGLIGEAYGLDESSPLIVKNCYSKGHVNADSDPGGFTAYLDSSAQIQDCYYDSETSGQSDNDGRGIPKTTAEMKKYSTYDDWDFSTVWGIGQDVNDGYPWLVAGYVITPLPQVARPRWAGYKLTWKDVENASSYIVRLYNEAGSVIDEQTVLPGKKILDYSNILSAGTFTATVQASGVVPE